MTARPAAQRDQHRTAPAEPAAPPLEAAVNLEVVGFGGVPIAVQVRPGGPDGGPSTAGPPVLLVHGFGSSARGNWAATGWLGTLHRAGLTSVTADLRGHGRSGHPHAPQAYRLPILLADLRAVLAALPGVLGTVPVIDLVGYSMGGRLVGELVAAATADPEPDHDHDHDPDLAGTWAGLPPIRRAVIGGYDGRALFDGVDPAAFDAAVTGVDGPDSAARRVARIALASRWNDIPALSAMVAGMGDDPSRLAATEVRVPTLVVAGDRDTVTPATLEWAAGLPDGRHLWLPGRNHISAVTSAVFRSAAVEFLTGPVR